jgi:hypothetical protein
MIARQQLIQRKRLKLNLFSLGALYSGATTANRWHITDRLGDRFRALKQPRIGLPTRR